jgi:hypothetical protein
MSPLFHCGLLGAVFYNGTDAGPGGPRSSEVTMFCGHHSPTRTLDRQAPEPARRPVDPATRVTDHERQATIDQLRLHTGVGRLDIDEFAARTERALKAQTAGDLAEITADLPFMESPDARDRRVRSARQEALRPYLSVMALLVGIWLFTSLAAWQILFFWPIFPMLGWGIPLFLGLRDQERRTSAGSTYA